mgnify:CR=1 FL=1
MRAALDLAAHENGGAPVPIADIARRQDISPRYLEQIFNLMKRAGVVVSKPGAKGGYKLARPQMEITVGDIMRAVEGPTAAVKCVASAQRRADINCPRLETCSTHKLWQRLSDKIDNFFDSVTIKEIIDEENRFRSEPS